MTIDCVISFTCKIFIDEASSILKDGLNLNLILYYLWDFLLCSWVEGEDGLFLISDKHEGIVFIIFIVGGEFHVGNHEVIELILNKMIIYLFFFSFEPKFSFTFSDRHHKIYIYINFYQLNLINLSLNLSFEILQSSQETIYLYLLNWWRVYLRYELFYFRLSIIKISIN